MANPLLTMLIRPAMRRRNARKLALGSRTGIYEARFVDIGGTPQWITIRGRDRRSPVLLFVHGGPGSPYTPFNSWLLEWEQHFTLVQWDQRGGGRTFMRNGTEGCGRINLDQLASDGVELAEFLRTYLEVQKLVLLGSSVGSLTGAICVRRRPDLFSAYVGANQSGPSSQPVKFALTKQAALKTKNRKGLTLLDRMDADHSSWTIEQYRALDRLAVKESPGVPNIIYDLMLPALLWNPEYSLREIRAIQKGMDFSIRELFRELMAVDVNTLGHRFDLPFFIFQGDGDILTPSVTARAYFDSISAPHKAFVTIPGGHLVEFANPARFLQGLLRVVLPRVDRER
jgi:pimeloyl-ACP methyl ester carboxylesterase